MLGTLRYVIVECSGGGRVGWYPQILGADDRFCRATLERGWCCER